jgi:hypothetical protein
MLYLKAHCEYYLSGLTWTTAIGRLRTYCCVRVRSEADVLQDTAELS